MNKNLHVYRNLGVPCLRVRCAHCERDATHSVYFEIDRQRQKQCSLGCCHCGRGQAISESVYDELYELSFEFDRLENGEISFETFRKAIPERCEKFLIAQDPDENRTSSNKESPTASEVEKVEEPTAAVFRRSELPVVSLANKPFSLFGTGIILAGVVGITLLGVSLAVDLPDWLSGNRWMALCLGSMLTGLVAGVLMSYKRFPRRVMIGPERIEVFARGSEQVLVYPHESVSRVNYGEGAKYLTLWFSDGKTFVVEAGPGSIPSLDRYYGRVK